MSSEAWMRRAEMLRWATTRPGASVSMSRFLSALVARANDAGEVECPTRDLATRFGVTPRRVRALLQEARRAGWLRMIRRGHHRLLITEPGTRNGTRPGGGKDSPPRGGVVFPSGARNGIRTEPPHRGRTSTRPFGPASCRAEPAPPPIRPASCRADKGGLAFRLALPFSGLAQGSPDG